MGFNSEFKGLKSVTPVMGRHFDYQLLAPKYVF